MESPCLTNSFGEFLDDVARRLKLGQEQGYCTTCRLWQWPDQCPHPKLSKKQFQQLVKIAKAGV